MVVQFTPLLMRAHCAAAAALALTRAWNRPFGCLDIFGAALTDWRRARTQRTCAVKHSMSGWRNSQSACHTLRPFSSLAFCMKSDSRMWPQIGAKR